MNKIYTSLFVVVTLASCSKQNSESTTNQWSNPSARHSEPSRSISENQNPVSAVDCDGGPSLRLIPIFEAIEADPINKVTLLDLIKNTSGNMSIDENKVAQHKFTIVTLDKDNISVDNSCSLSVRKEGKFTPSLPLVLPAKGGLPELDGEWQKVILGKESLGGGAFNCGKQIEFSPREGMSVWVYTKHLKPVFEFKEEVSDAEKNSAGVWIDSKSKLTLAQIEKLEERRAQAAAKGLCRLW